MSLDLIREAANECSTIVALLLAAATGRPLLLSESGKTK